MIEQATAWRSRLGREARALVSTDIWRRTLHLLVVTPWAVAMTVLSVLGLMLSAALLPVLLLGVPTFLGYGTALRRCARLETRWCHLVLGERVPMALRAPAGTGWAQRAGHLVLDPTLWRVAAYHLLRLPLALGTALLTLIAWGGGAWLLVAATHPPAWPFADTPLPRGSTAHALLHGPLRPVTAALLVTGGVALLIAAPTVVRALTLVHVAFAKAMLGWASTRQLRARVQEVERRRAEVVRAAEAERRRIERDLHDGAQQRLIHLVLTLGMVRHQFADDPVRAAPLLATAHQEAKQAIIELRDLTRGLHPPVLADRGLDAALSALAARSPVPVTIDVRLDRRPPRLIESIAYFMVAEALSNTAKHAQATRAQIHLAARRDALLIRVTDDGVGGADTSSGSGLAGLAERAHGVDGDLTVHSPAGGPTVLTMELPCGW
ncbi:sensor domain-containing protein [Micromonospora sp. NPDC048839]|uniref:sensor histidine kinase n=1 Tax=Micromonospora sp. NPDC048839 TaxID=3155641 RepID=UPI0033CF9F2D